MNCSEFTDDEIREELSQLGYHNVPQDKLEDFKKDLMKLISTERSKTNSLNSSRSTEPDCKRREPREEELEEGDSAVDENYNHGNPYDYDGTKFREDWCYQGKKENQQRPRTAPPLNSSQRKAKTANAHSKREHHPPTSGLQRNNHACFDDNVSDAGSDCRQMKRKTSRKAPNGCRHIDESFTDSDTGVFEIYEKIKRLAMRECECGKTQMTSGDVEPPYRIKGKVNKYPSVIKKLEPPHTRNLVRVNVYERHKMYKEGWKAKPPIGEDQRISLRKAVQAKLLHFDEIKLKQKVYVPNLYVPPHEKTRLDLRWQVRQAFERYELPGHGFYHEV